MLRCSKNRKAQTMKLSKRLLFFALSGSLGFLVDLGILSFLISLGGGELISRIPAIIMATIATFFMNRYFTFQDRPPKKSMIASYLHYLWISAIGIGINAVVYSIAISIFHINYSIALILATLSSMSFNFINYSWFIFKKSS